VELGDGKTLEITAKNLTADNIYVQSVLFNGNPYNKAFFNHVDLAKGAKIEFTMGPKPNKAWASEVTAAPMSLQDEFK
jgi:putative alpha-1,2-mannosidase